MTRIFKLRNLSGETVLQVATSPQQARDLSTLKNAAVVGSYPAGCGGDCGDCQPCDAIKEQAL